MLSHFVCGNFHHQEEDGVTCSSPKKSKRKSNKNNPYSNRGLDKFSELLADLDERRQKVYSQMSPQEISFVRFAYSSKDDFVPIVVKVKDKDLKKHKSEELKKVTSFSEQLEKSSEEDKVVGKKKQHKKNVNFSWDIMLKRPSFYVPAVVILILVFLIVFGKSVTTLCTCLVWYVVPMLSEYQYDSSKTSHLMLNSKKKDYVKGWLNEMKNPQDLASPRSGDFNEDSSGKHGHQKSW